MSSKDKSTKKYEIDMCSGPIVSKLLLFTGPLMLSSILQLLFNAADVIVVGKFAGDNSLAAVGSVGPVVNFVVNLFTGLAIGANVLASRYYGARDEKRFGTMLHTSMLVSVIIGIVLGALGAVMSRQILVGMDSPAEVIGLATIYLRLFFLGIPAQSIYNFGSAILRAVGDTKRPMYYLSFAGVVNVILNLLFVVVFKMDVAGVALATIISQYLSAIMVVMCMAKENGMLRLEFGRLAIDKFTFIKIIQIGIPSSIQGVCFSFSNIIIQASINSFGATVVAGSSAAGNIEGFVYVAMNAFCQACMAFVSANVGGRKFERINSVVVKAELCVITVGLVLGNITYYFGYPLLGLYTDSQAVMDAGIVRLFYIVVPYCLCGMMDVMVGGIRGLGYAITPMIVSLVGVCGVRLFWIFTFFRMPVFHDPKYLYLTYPFTWALTFVVHVISFIIMRKSFNKKMNEASVKSAKGAM